MRDKTLVITLLMATLMLTSISVAPAVAFIYSDGSQDERIELFGPRIDRILIKIYEGTDPEFAALQQGEIDITDWALTKSWITTFSTDPNIRVVGYGGEVGYYTFNFNHNNNTNLGNPPNPTYPNPRFPNPTSVPALRQALSHLVDRVALVAGPGEGLYDAIFTPIPSYMKAWIHPDIKYGGLLEPLAYPPSISAAAAKLTAGGFPIGSDGWRYWDMNGNGVKDAGEDLNLIIYTRMDALRKGAGDMLCAGLDDPAIKIHYTRYAVGGGDAWQKCMVEKDYHAYTAGWIFIGPDPDYLYDLYHWDNYYHPEDPPNFGGINDPTLNDLSKNGIKYAPDVTTALNSVLAWQERFAEIAAEIPLASTSAPKAYFKTYTGGNKGVPVVPDDGENKYRGAAWTHIVNEMGQGENAIMTTHNAYPEGFYFGDGKMTMRYGWKEYGMPETLNPLYSSWYWEWEVLSRIFDSLGGRDPYTKGPFELPFLAENWTVGTWIDPADSKEKSKVTIKIRPDAAWQDGTPFTLDDVVFTFVELPKLLEAKSAPAVWWQPTIDQMQSFFVVDKYTVEILLKVKSVWAVGWVVGNIIIPRHIWKPLIETQPVEVFSGNLWPAHPEAFVGSFGFTLKTVTESTILMERHPSYYQTMDKCVNKITGSLEGITITSADYTGATPPTAPHIFAPNKVKPSASSKYPGGDPAGTVNVTVRIPLTNLNWNFTQDVDKTVELVYPDGHTEVVVPTTNVVIPAHDVHIETVTLSNLGVGNYTIKVTVEIKSGEFYDWVMANLNSTQQQERLGPRTVSKSFWVTIPEDISGKGTINVPEPDITVDMKDVRQAAKAFGSYPGHARWSAVADMNGDYSVDMKDIRAIAKLFGWAPP